ncbi:co-chaperone DjlA [Enterobacteriaceae endosymbiont of Donacia bicoloricornis]|uniref:co-chaperone DjlA n=1 Tax=Enterobacteriaceae endosymbiont of Donacia bicoloricornis TaxID=2675772 RepID=UPI001449B026|nr:co-chaperone DjlA [Enterobacteriaceae endosymbiont of Donacia bicoloricornis]QJC37696.1 co-chaperone DjlA [Enterobacteriaceae endosymbiont of Donacia bicoloricornis]
MFSYLQLLFFLINLIINYYVSFNLLNIILLILISFLINKITNFYNKKYNYNNKNNIKKLFLKTNFEVMGYISKSKGFINKNDINFTIKLIKKMNLNDEETIFAKKSFNNGKKKNYPLVYELNNLNYLIYKNKSLINKFLEIQIELSFINNFLNNKNKKILNIIFQELNISFIDLFFIIKKLKYNNKFINEKDLFDNYFFHQNKEEKKYNYNNNFYKNNNFQTKNNSQSELDKAYKLLGINYNDNLLTIKRAYHKLISKYHPDKLISKGYSSKQLEIAKIKTQNIHKAYNIIKKNIT